MVGLVVVGLVVVGLVVVGVVVGGVEMSGENGIVKDVPPVVPPPGEVGIP